MKTIKKLSLTEIKVESFVTSLNKNEKETVNGGLAVAVTTVIVGITLVECSANPRFCVPETVTVEISNAACTDSQNMYCNGIQTKDVAGCLGVSLAGGPLGCVSAFIC